MKEKGVIGGFEMKMKKKMLALTHPHLTQTDIPADKNPALMHAQIQQPRKTNY